MTLNDIKFGFKIDRIVESEETGSTAYYMTHNKTGAELLFLKNEDENKTFGIGFKTPPTDSTGVAHIVEHSVLSGSRKFKVREPFMELLKGSMQTFLNAMTFSDMTIYPISSMNDKDFLNLTDVYLDSVFYPAMYEKKEVFMQEGWHHELLNSNDPITYKGVVYNEMRGAYSSPERQVFGDIMRNLHPGSTYSHESGGYPYDIPKLSFENFVDFHKRYYHPSNSFIFLYGNVDIDTVLNMINGEYLENFDRRDTQVEMNLSDTNKKVREMDFYYAADESADDENNTYFSYSVNHGTTEDSKDVFMNALLGEILVNSESAPIKLALLEKGLGEDVFGIDSGSYFQDFGIVVKNTDIGRKDEFLTLVDKTLEDIVENGFNKDLLLASINRTEFAMREAQGTLKGIIYFINAMSSWRYGEDPLLGLNFNSIFKELRDNLETGYFENYIKEKILGSDNKLITTHRPKFGLFAEADEKAELELKEYKESLTQNEIEELIRTNQELIKFQTTEDSKEGKATIPHLELTDIKKEIPEIHQDVLNYGDYSVYFHEQNSSGISYVTLSFEMNHLKSIEDIFIVSTLAKFLGIVDTENYSYIDLNNEILKYTSGIRTSPAIFKIPGKRNKYESRFLVSSSAIGENSKKMFELILEVIKGSKLNNKTRLKEILNMEKSSMEMHIDSRGDEFVTQRVKASFSAADAYREKLNGLSYYDYLNDLLQNFDSKSDSLIEKLETMLLSLVSRNGMEIFITAEKVDKSELIAESTALADNLPVVTNEEAVLEFPMGELKEAITSASGVQYVSKGFNIVDSGYKYSGAMVVLTSLLSKDYLHNSIRARGGAYGAGISIDQSGDCVTFSYRDPNLDKTIEAYDRVGDYLRSGSFDEDDVKNYIIGTMTKFTPPMAPSDINSVMLTRRYSNITREDIQRNMNNALSVTKEDLMGYADMMDELMKQSHLSVYGNTDVIGESKAGFTEIRPLKTV